MNRKISAVAAVVLMLAVIICAALPAFAALAPTQDGVYEVSVKMYHAQKDRRQIPCSYRTADREKRQQDFDYSNARERLGYAVLVLQKRRS